MGKAMGVLNESNPFDDGIAVEHSNYCRFDGKSLIRLSGRPESGPLTAFVHDGFRALMLNEHFTCVGAKAAIRGGDYRFGFYDDLGSSPACAGLARDLFAFLQERNSFQGPFSTFVASFSGPATANEVAFEDLLWQTLQRLHDLDVAHHEWDPKVVADPVDRNLI
jgi:FPC/CPF motif-containing protein YcgG